MLGSPGTGLAHLFYVSLLSFYFGDLILTTKISTMGLLHHRNWQIPQLELRPPTQGWLLTMYWHSWTQLLNSKVCSECNNSDLRDIFSTIACHAGATNLPILLLLPSSVPDLAMPEIVVFIMVVTPDTLTSLLSSSWHIYSCDVSGWDFQPRRPLHHFCPIFFLLK